jgi:uncharacterized RDD family membrane protein YckC
MTNNWEPPNDDKAPIPFAPPINEVPSAPVFSGGAHTETLASWGRRVGGYLIDMILVFVVAQIAGSIARAIGPNWLAIVVAAVVAFLYPFLMIAKVQGQTVGMKAVKIRCVSLATGEVPDLGRSAGRAAAAIAIDSVGAMLLFIPALLDLLWPLWDKQRQTLHDKVAVTVVIVVAPPSPDQITFS